MQRRGWGLLRLTRPGNVLLALVTLCVGYGEAGGWRGSLDAPGEIFACFWSSFAWHALAALSIFAAGNVINDVCDVDVDRINAPTRPLPSGDVDLRAAIVWTGVLFGMGLAASIVAGRIAGWWATYVAVWAIAWLIVYSLWLKGRPLVGNVTIAMLAGLLVLYGAHAHHGAWLAGLTGAVFAAGVTFARELVKDLADVEGDRALGLRTLAIVEPSWTRGLVVIATVVVGRYGVALIREGTQGVAADALLGAALATIVVLTGLALVTDASRHLRTQARIWKLAMLLGMGALIVGGLDV